MNKKILALYLSVIVVLLFFSSALPHFRPAQISVVTPTPFSSAEPTAQTAISPQPAAQASPSVHVLGVQTKTSDCVVRGPLPDPDCTPGAIFPNVTSEQICVSGYTSSVRDVPVSVKTAVYREYGIYTHQTGEYEIDHYISLELGGSNDISNLFPEAAVPTPGFHEKDKVENYLHRQVCNGTITLKEAQAQISTNWLQVYRQIPQ